MSIPEGRMPLSSVLGCCGEACYDMVCAVLPCTPLPHQAFLRVVLSLLFFISRHWPVLLNNPLYPSEPHFSVFSCLDRFSGIYFDWFPGLGFFFHPCRILSLSGSGSHLPLSLYPLCRGRTPVAILVLGSWFVCAQECSGNWQCFHTWKSRKERMGRGRLWRAMGRLEPWGPIAWLHMHLFTHPSAVPVGQPLDTWYDLCDAVSSSVSWRPRRASCTSKDCRLNGFIPKDSETSTSWIVSI